ncbi:capsule assembly Wzi family protein [Rhodohalobacter mucosus]|uniref:Capsule assembly protein Wzi n=1 Tax=Rhodohalobacter mucosus TaxID=2079485 RepID=A0A316TUV9_9BACT|nr:capsule assembly Wzi family protein [Rhodohalobacter mucosus]PWN06132.1 hypothetical protein DDZ15_09815 [Rhodohalobacter mucosus]
MALPCNNLVYKIFISLGLFLLLAGTINGQSHRLVNTHSWQYEYIQRLQERGHLLQLNPTDLPYTEGEIREALRSVSLQDLGDREREWYNLLSERFEARPVNIDSMRVGGLFEGGARRSSSDRLNVIDPSGDGEIILPRGKLNGYMEWKNWIGQAGVTFDWFYDIDPDGLDTADRLYIRSEETYLGYNGERVEFYVGRFDNHWSTYGRQGAFLTDNPRSFDQIQFKLGSEKLSFSTLVGELDNLRSDSTFTGQPSQTGSILRYIYMHRLDWSPFPNLKLSFIEAELYYSPNAGFSIRNLVPLHFMFFESDNLPKNVGANFILGGSVWYQSGKSTFYIQAMLDDLIVENRSELRENDELIPTTYTINSSLKVADIADRFDMGLEADLVGANAYRSRRFQDQWTYAQRGLATNFSDYVRTKAYLTFYPEWSSGLKIEPAVTFYWKGTEDLRELRTSVGPDGSQIPGILAGTIERTVRPSLNLRYQPAGMKLFGEENDVRFNMWLDADIGVNYVENANNIEGDTTSPFIGLLRFFGQVTF